MRDLDDLLRRHHGVLLARDFPPSRQRALRRAAAAGLLAAPFPGVWIPTGDVGTGVRGQVVCARFPDAVLIDGAAAELGYWPERQVRSLAVAGIHLRRPPSWLEPSRRKVPPELVARVAGLRLTAPFLTALDLADETDGRAGVDGWRSNWKVRCRGRTYFLDLAFPALRVAIEIDGRSFHDSAEAFEADLHRHNALVCAGWTVLHITWAMIRHDPAAVIEQIRAVLRAAARAA